MNDVTAPDSLQTAMRWIADLLTGSIGTSVCVLGIAALGLLMLLGFVPTRKAAAAVIGCFIILSAGTVANGLTSRPYEVSSPPPIAVEPVSTAPAKPPYDPYAFASLPR